MKRLFHAIAAVLCAAVIFVSPAGLSAEILEQVLVKVNGDIITKTELEQRQIAVLRLRMNSAVDADALKNDEQLRKMIAEITPRILVEAIDELLLLQLGKEKGYRVTDAQFKDWVADIRKDQGLDDDKKFQAALQQEGMTMEELRHNFEQQVIRYRVQQDEIGGKLSITEEEARQYYLTRQHEFVEPATVTLREIFLEIPTASAGGQSGINVAAADEVEQNAQAVRARVVGGEDFAKVASEVSTAGSKANGGLIGPIAVGELSPALQELLKKMKPGDVTQPLRAAKGFQILKLETMTEPVTKPFDAVRDLVADKVFQERQRVEVRRFLSRLRGQALIVWKNQDLKKAYEEQVKSAGPDGGN